MPKKAFLKATAPTSLDTVIKYSIFYCILYFFLRLAESIYGGRFGHVGPGNGYGEWALTTRESGLYRYHWVHRASTHPPDVGCTGWYL